MFCPDTSYQEFISRCQSFLDPKSVYYCDGTKKEYERLSRELLDKGFAKKLNGADRLYFHSDEKDVARVENRTFICSKRKCDAGVTNNWLDPDEMKDKLSSLFKGSMRGRVMYVIFYLMGPIDSAYSKLGLEITDSPYVVLNMHLMTRMGDEVLKRFKQGQEFSVGVHSVGYPLKAGQKDIAWPCNDEKYIAHFPQENSVYSYGSGYGGNALLAKKCFALRLASCQARDEGWLAEHMLIIAVTNPKGIKRYFAAAFPSACGKTNLAMMESQLEGYKLECVGDDIAWMHIGSDGHLYAINPENGFFGVAPGTSLKTNPNAMKSIEKKAIFTNVALTDEGEVWWEGMDKPRPKNVMNWKGQRPSDDSIEPLSHPNARFTTNIKNCPILDSKAEDPKGVKIDGIIFGGRNSKIMPLVLESFSFEHGVFLGACLSSEKTAASEGKTGELRHDPFAMLPFCGYNMADYFSHWMSFRKFKMPKIFHVNWFRKGDDTDFLWPGYCENMRVIKWMYERLDNTVTSAEKTPLGYVAKKDDLDISGLNLKPDVLEKLLGVDPDDYADYVRDLRKYFDNFKEALDPLLLKQLDQLESRIYEGCSPKS